MTVSSYRGIPVSKAGERFGLSLTDLEELFDLQEAGEEAKGDFFSLPLKEAQFTEKGRGGVLGYKAARTPSILKTFGVTEKDSGGGSNVFNLSNVMQERPQSAPAAPVAPAPAPPKIGPLSSFIGPQGDPTKQVIGLAGVQRAMEAGLTPGEIRSRAQQEGLGFGTQAASALGVSPAAGGTGSAQPTRMAGDAFANATSSVDAGSGASYAFRDIATDTHGAVRAAGPMTDAAVKAMLAGRPREEWVLPASVAGPGQPYQAPAGVDYVRPGQTTSAGAASSGPSLSSFIGSAGTAGTLGQAAVDRARSSGLSDAQIRQMAQQQGLTLGAAAAASLR
jgi:hypothetical protein